MKRWSQEKRALCVYQGGMQKACHSNCMYALESDGLMGCMLVDKVELEILKLKSPKEYCGTTKKRGRPKKLGEQCSEDGKPSL